MLEWFRSWATGIVIAVIIATIIEMILPNSTSKKYIKIIIGIFIVYTIISPVIGSFKGEDLNNYIKVENYIQSNSNALKTNEVSDNAQSSIKKIYAQNLQNDLKTKLKEKGYISNNIYISISIIFFKLFIAVHISYIPIIYGSLPHKSDKLATINPCPEIETIYLFAGNLFAAHFIKSYKFL